MTFGLGPWGAEVVGLDAFSGWVGLPSWCGVYIYVYVYMYVYTCMCVCVYIYVYVCMYVCVCMCVYVYMYIYIYIYVVYLSSFDNWYMCKVSIKSNRMGKPSDYCL